MSAKMGPITADITKSARTREAATGVHAQEVIGPKELEDPVLVSQQKHFQSNTATDRAT